jgi:hypothetical protein
MVTFVSAFLDLSEDRTALRSPDTHLQHFLKIARSGINVHLFLNKACSSFEEILREFPNIHIEYVEISELRTFASAQEARLPAVRNIKKDTRNFLLFINAKPEFVYRAIQCDIWKTMHYYWIDFGIFHVISDVPRAQKLLRQISSQQLSGLFIPGCVNMAPFEYFNYVCWRFCGGVFAGDRQSLIDFYHAVFEEYDKIVQERGLTWEVNTWAYLESTGKISPTWLHADHNDSILHIPIARTFPSINVTPIFVPQKLFHDRYANTNAYVPMNPSLYIEQGRVTVLVRCVNYRKYKDKQFTVYNMYSDSKYFCIRGVLGERFDLGTVEECTVEPKPSYQSYWKGLEDIRFVTGDQILATIPEFTPSGNPTIFHASLTGSHIHSFEHCQPSSIEKNWMPYLDKVVYSVNPFCIKDIKDDTRRCISEDPVLQGWHGSTNGIPWEGGFLFLIHVNRDVSYHRWLLFRNDTVTYSDEFTFFRNTYIEFPCSLCMDAGRVFISMGVNDDSALVVEVAVEEIAAWI